VGYDEASPPAAGARPWSRADAFWTTARASAGPSAHFRTSAHAGTVLATALVRLLHDIDDRLGRPAVLDLVEVGAGGGELLAAVLRLVDAEADAARDLDAARGLDAARDLAARLRPLGVDLLPRPVALDPRIRWVEAAAPASVPDVHGLLVAHEWLDELPVDVVEVDEHGIARLVLVEDDGREHLGPTLADDGGCAALGVDGARARAWLEAWWPVRLPGERAEVGHARDDAWLSLLRRVRSGTALAIDYGHTRHERTAGGFSRATMAGYLAGRRVTPRPDGSVNLTAHVAFDTLAHGERAVDQRDALLALGVNAAVPPRSLASTDPAAYADALVHASDVAELLDPTGLGAFLWLRVDI
jgi:SAM-dependent MidA family methyltransferase